MGNQGQWGCDAGNLAEGGMLIDLPVVGRGVRGIGGWGEASLWTVWAVGSCGVVGAMLAGVRVDLVAVHLCCAVLFLFALHVLCSAMLGIGWEGVRAMVGVVCCGCAVSGGGCAACHIGVGLMMIGRVWVTSTRRSRRMEFTVVYHGVVSENTILILERVHLRDSPIGVEPWEASPERRSMTRSYDINLNGQMVLRVGTYVAYLRGALVSLRFFLRRIGAEIPIDPPEDGRDVLLHILRALVTALAVEHGRNIVPTAGWGVSVGDPLARPGLWGEIKEGGSFCMTPCVGSSWHVTSSKDPHGTARDLLLDLFPATDANIPTRRAEKPLPSGVTGCSLLVLEGPGSVVAQALLDTGAVEEEEGEESMEKPTPEAEEMDLPPEVKLQPRRASRAARSSGDRAPQGGQNHVGGLSEDREREGANLCNPTARTTHGGHGHLQALGHQDNVVIQVIRDDISELDILGGIPKGSVKLSRGVLAVLLRIVAPRGWRSRSSWSAKAVDEGGSTASSTTWLGGGDGGSRRRWGVGEAIPHLLVLSSSLVGLL
ncbi:hypothetical protein CBR_g4317 [Chara braunii]|uniref:Uncharacterized protein n=1 Tax=Chara braunii TaxID=69332 RepID=A0A388JRA8_CHABU|nr:hypothetical protein CBR_g4317 [Chara braunii]|eukprot:GBG60359.1 hypothetical protein CBR_g4317 [Chara braunii]